VAFVVCAALGCSPQLVASQTQQNGPVPEGADSEVIPVKHALATDIGDVLDLLSTNRAITPRSELMGLVQTTLDLKALQNDLEKLGPARIFVYERSNSLLVRAPTSERSGFRRLIRRLDTALAQVLIEMSVLQVPLKDADSLRRAAAQVNRPSSSCPQF
jgi:type II secretory pathway component GspD/PulD (secretin)